MIPKTGISGVIVSKKILKVRLLFVWVSAILLMNCAEKISQPESVQFSTTVHVLDTSFVTRGIFDRIDVPGGEVTLSSVNYGLQYKSKTNPGGIALFQDLIPDFYNCSVQRIYPEDTVQQYLGVLQEQVLVGSKGAIRMSSPADSFSLILSQVSRAPFLISEIYYNGAPPPPPLYFHDQFTEIYNNSSVTVYLDGYAIGDVDYGYRDDPEFIHCIHLYQFPGSGTDYPVEPGETIIIAQDAENHTLKNPRSLDLSSADFEYYNPLSNDIDVESVPNMIQIHHKYGYDFLYSVMNDAVCLFKMVPGDTLGYDEFNLILVPKEWVIDGVEYKEDPTQYHLKRLSDDIDAGITGGMPAYQGKSVARKIFKIIGNQKVLMDNNNSSIDFEVTDNPTPGWIE
ncbi:MAG: hypothetical protein Kow0042_05210 [Calditrichia bacterium]